MWKLGIVWEDTVKWDTEWYSTREELEDYVAEHNIPDIFVEVMEVHDEWKGD